MLNSTEGDIIVDITAKKSSFRFLHVAFIYGGNLKDPYTKFADMQPSEADINLREHYEIRFFNSGNC